MPQNTGPVGTDTFTMALLEPVGVSSRPSHQLEALLLRAFGDYNSTGGTLRDSGTNCWSWSQHQTWH